MLEQRLIDEQHLQMVLNAGWLVKLVTPTGKFIVEREQQQPEEDVSDLKAEDIVTPSSPFDELSEDEILYWSVPHYDQIQSLRDQQQRLKDEEMSKHG